ncbi:MAG: hypothetical protein HN435_01620, partial [Nitrospinaceae bacterium]|nr:hypothetical protein [Nitrospinaceae bacterium]
MKHRPIHLLAALTIGAAMLFAPAGADAAKSKGKKDKDEKHDKDKGKSKGIAHRVAALEALASSQAALITLLQTQIASIPTGPHTVDTTRTNAEIVAAVGAAGYVTGAHTVDTDTNTQRTNAEILSVVGPHTVDTDTQRTDTEIVALSLAAVGPHTVDTDTQLDLAGVQALGFVTGAHTIDTDTNTQRTDLEITTLIGPHTVDTDTDTQLDLAGVQALGFVTGAHTTDTNTQRTDTEIVALSLSAVGPHTVDTNTQRTDLEITTLIGPHTVDTDTNTQLDLAGVQSLGFVTGAHTASSVLDPYVTVDANDNIFITGANLHVRDGSSDTGGAINGLGNLIVGYDENSSNIKTGSHNIVVGPYHTYSSYGGLVA